MIVQLRIAGSQLEMCARKYLREGLGMKARSIRLEQIEAINIFRCCFSALSKFFHSSGHVFDGSGTDISHLTVLDRAVDLPSVHASAMRMKERLEHAFGGSWKKDLEHVGKCMKALCPKWIQGKEDEILGNKETVQSFLDMKQAHHEGIGPL